MHYYKQKISLGAIYLAKKLGKSPIYWAFSDTHFAYCDSCTLYRRLYIWHITRSSKIYSQMEGILLGKEGSNGAGCTGISKHLCHYFNTVRPEWTCRHFADDIFEFTFLTEHLYISIKISLTLAKGSIDNTTALVHVMTWCRTHDNLSHGQIWWWPSSMQPYNITRQQWMKVLLQILCYIPCE